MALHTLGTTSTTALQTALTFSQALLDSDIGNLDAQITSDIYAAQPATVPDAPNPPGNVGSQPPGIIATGTTSTSSPNITAMTFVAGAPLAAITPGLEVLGQGIPAGSYVVSFSGTTLTIGPSNPSANASGVFILIVPQADNDGFSRNGLLLIPNRGILKMRRGDVVAVDNTGWPILVSGGSINYQGTVWTFT